MLKNHVVYERAACIPGRSNTRSKAPGAFFPVGAGPHYASYGEGPYVHDVDGRKYLDMLCGLGAISLGYELKKKTAAGVCSLPYEAEVVAAERVLQEVTPWASQVKFMRTGTEALAASVWLARLATGRRPVLVAKGSYHGWLPWTSQRGVVGTDGEWTFEYLYGDIMEFEPLTDSPPAAIIVEPARWEKTPPDYLKWLEEEAHACGALFIVDEMIYGGRWRLGGATELYGLKPDLACYGKALGNGAAVALVAGGDVLATHGTLVSGTYSGDATAARALLRTLEAYKTFPVVPTLWRRGSELQTALREAVAAAGWESEAFVEGAGAVHQRLRFADPTLAPRFSALMAEHGILWHPACVNVMFAHTTQHIDQVGQAAYASLKALAG